MTYPEHEKLRALGERRDEVQAFIDWLLDETPLTLAAWDQERPLHRRTYGRGGSRLMMAEPSDLDGIRDFDLRGGLRESLLAAYFDIDPRKLSDEKDQMLAALRAKAVP